MQRPIPQHSHLGGVKYTTHTFANVDRMTLDATVNAFLSTQPTDDPKSHWVADIQFSTAQQANNVVLYSCMVIVGLWLE